MTTGQMAAINRKNGILKTIRENPFMAQSEVAELFGVSRKRVNHIAVGAGLRRRPCPAETALAHEDPDQ